MEADLETQLQHLARTAAKTEHFAVRHCEREAERLRHAVAVGALLSIADHARASLEVLPSVMERDGLAALGPAHEVELFEELREVLAGFVMENERAYRATIVSLRHGVALMHDVWSSARTGGKVTLSGFCEAWVATRSSLIDQAESELTWLHQHPEKGTHWSEERQAASNVLEDESSGSE